MCDRKVFATHSSDLSTNTSENAQADVRAAGLWTRGEGSYFDVKVFHPDAPSVQIQIANQPLRPEHMVRNAVASHLEKAKSLFVLNRLADFVTRERPVGKPRVTQLQTATVTNSAAKFAQAIAKVSRYSGSV